jgi:hypothetical protein
MPFPDATADSCLEGATAGAEYLAQNMTPDGRFGYHYDACKDRLLDDPYSDTRHAGAALALAQAYVRVGRPRFRDVADLALQWLERQVEWDGDRAFVVFRDATRKDAPARAKLGTQALTLLLLDSLVAPVSSQVSVNASGKTRRQIAHGLATGIASLQRTDGSMAMFAPLPGIADERPNDYFLSEAALALAKHATVVQNPEWSARARRATLFRIGELRAKKARLEPMLDAWLMQALSEFERQADDPETVPFLKVLGQEILALKRGADKEDPGFGFMGERELHPSGMPTASLGEGLASGTAVLRARGEPDWLKWRDVVRGAASFVLKHQYTARHAFYLPSPALAHGGFRSVLTRGNVRIDGVQHAVSFLLLAERLFRDESP